MLDQAIKSRLPFVQVKTDDLIYIQEVLSAIAGESVVPLVIPKECENVANFPFPKDNVYYTGGAAAENLLSAKFWLHCKAHEKTVVFVNTKTSVLAYNGGVMFPPKELMLKFITDLTKDEKQAMRLLPSYGGLTLKDIFEVTKITRHRVGKLDRASVNETRQGYVNRLRGVTQVSTADQFYRCPSQLAEWMNLNARFFMKPVSAELTPRGLLLDGEPGVGKSSGAKFVAKQFGIPLYRLDIGGMKGKYVGVSEENLNAALGQVDQLEPCVVLFDEIEKVFAETHDSGVTTSLLSTILWWLQEHRSKVFSVMTTNNAKKIPAELYRPGRIDQTMIFSGFTKLDDALDFAAEVYEHTISKIEDKLPGKMPLSENFAARISAQLGSGADGSARTIPHGRVTKEVHDLVKTLIVNGGGEPVAA